MLTISGKALGQRKPLFADFSVAPPVNVADGGDVLLRDVIETIVRHEVVQFKTRQENRQFIRALTAREIEAAAETGKVDSGGSDVPLPEVDEEQAVANALTAFQDGIFLVVIDEQEQRDLDAQVYLRPDSQLTFIRLTLLAGG